MPAHRTFAVPAAAVALTALAMTGITAAGASATASAPSAPSVLAAGAGATCARDYSPVPENWSTEKGGLEIGHLTKVISSNGVVKVRIDRVSFYRGPEAVELNGGEPPLDDYLLTDTDARQRTYVLDPKASLQAEYLLRNDLGSDDEEVGRQTLTRTQFVRNALALQGDDDPVAPLVWLRHTDGFGGPVTAIAEQYTP